MKTNYETVVGTKYQNYGEEKMLSLKNIFSNDGILVFDNFIQQDVLLGLEKEAMSLCQDAYRSSTAYNPFIDAYENVASERLRNIQFTTEKSCICYDQIPENSALKFLYQSEEFQSFLSRILWVENFYPYADPLWGININYYDPGDSLEWHYDNCSFTITLLLKKPDAWWSYEYFANERYDDAWKEDYQKLENMISGALLPKSVDLEEGTLVIFRGTESLHRVTPIERGQRILVTFCYNLYEGISLSEKSRMTFFGRLK